MNESSQDPPNRRERFIWLGLFSCPETSGPGFPRQCGPSGRENRLGLPGYSLEASQQATVHAVRGDIWTAPGCVLMALG